MIIKKIEIQNFRSYYKENVFEVENGLNLIIGSNGDGKTTFYDALEWLFRTDGINNMDEKYISKKRSAELLENGSDDVSVSMIYEHNGCLKRLDKMFHFTKSFDGNISVSNYTHTLTEENGVERIAKTGILFDSDLPFEIRRYIMFKGETELDVFQKSNALKMLIETFSDVKDFEAYFKFMEYARIKADQARDNAQKLDKKNADKIKNLNRTIEHERGILSEIEHEITQKEEEASNFEQLLKDIEQSKEASELLIAVNRRIDSLTKRRDEIKCSIKEDYTINLLDDKWILMGFEPIAKEYSDKVSIVDQKRREMEQKYYYDEGMEKAIKKMKTNFTPLPVHIPGRAIMQEMLDQEVCKICGRPAAKHTEPWEFMKQRLDEFEASLRVDEEDEKIKPLYENNYIGELQKRDTSLNDNLNSITTLRHRIQEKICLNNRLHQDVIKAEENISKEFENKKRILAQADGLTEDQLTASYTNISNWINQKQKADNRVSELKAQRTKHRAAFEDAQNDLGKLAEGTTAALYAKTATIIRHISEAFKTAKDTNKKRLLQAIEDEANIFMEKLNTNDFKGTIRIIEKADGQGEAVLNNDDGTRIFTPNTALRTTYLMSVLFAIGKLSSQRNETEFPLIFDAPTSSFTEAKETEFFNVIGNLKKQVIIVTKSFLKETKNGDLVLDDNKINNVHGRVFRIEKKKPFDDKKLSTIQTQITKVK